MHPTTTYRSSLAGSVLAATGATACCFLPLALVASGLGGAWIASLRMLEPLQPLFAGIMFLCLGMAFHTLYIRPKRCTPGDVCAAPQVLRRQRIIYWIVVAFIVVMGVVYAIYNGAYL
jgi:mercuric ion transport protein